MFTFPINETYVAFGDGSSNDAGSFYGLVLIPELNIGQIEKELGNIKDNFGGESGCPIHCRELFNVHARKKSMWSHLSNENVVALCGETLGMIQLYQPKYLLAYVPKAHYPKRFRLKGKNGHADLVHDIDEKWLTMWAFFRIGGYLDPLTPILPDDPKIKPRSLNRPHWNIVIKRTEPGFRVREVYLDREKTKVRWFSKSLQWISVARELVIENQNGQTYLPIVHPSVKKHLLLDIADIFTYSLAREFANNRSIDYDRFCGEVHVEKMVDFGQEIIAGG